MGIYINPQHQNKTEWLANHGVILCTSKDDVINKLRDCADEYGLFEKEFPVVLIDNGNFKAAAVCWCRAEVERFYDPGDPRPMTWWLVPVERLKEVLSESDFETVRVKGPIDARMRFTPRIPDEYL